MLTIYNFNRTRKAYVSLSVTTGAVDITRSMRSVGCGTGAGGVPPVTSTLTVAILSPARQLVASSGDNPPPRHSSLALSHSHLFRITWKCWYPEMQSRSVAGGWTSEEVSPQLPHLLDPGPRPCSTPAGAGRCLPLRHLQLSTALRRFRCINSRRFGKISGYLQKILFKAIVHLQNSGQ